jgi:hypothetical protein
MKLLVVNLLMLADKFKVFLREFKVLELPLRRRQSWSIVPNLIKDFSPFSDLLLAPCLLNLKQSR